MATPRQVSVSITVANSQVDVTSDLVSCTFEEALNSVGETLEIALDNKSGLYSGEWFPPNGTTISAVITTTNWNTESDNARRSTHTMWIDTIDYDLKPSTVTFKATSVSPQQCNGEVHYAGYEGQSTHDIYGIQGQDIDSLLNDGNSAANANDGSTSTSDGNSDTDLQRTDMDNQSYLSHMKTLAEAQGEQIMVVGGQLWFFSEQQYESQAPVKTFTVGQTSIIRGKLITTYIDKFASAKVAYMNPKTGSLVAGSFVPKVPPIGAKAILNSRKRPLIAGTSDNLAPSPGVAVDTGQPGNPWDNEA